jgi:adenosylcobinamide kinase/adenosylcobinamide-phosphate guanylyltransferase
MPIILIGGGSRSGKSRHALELARERGARRAFIATAQPLDDEMRGRIHAHQQERGPGFTTIEEPIALPAAIERHSANYDVLVVDCLTLWLANIQDVERQSWSRTKSAVELYPITHWLAGSAMKPAA